MFDRTTTTKTNDQRRRRLPVAASSAMGQQQQWWWSLVTVVVMTILITSIKTTTAAIDTDDVTNTESSSSSSTTSSCATKLQQLQSLSHSVSQQSPPFVTHSIWLPSTISNFSSVHVVPVHSYMAIINATQPSAYYYCDSHNILHYNDSDTTNTETSSSATMIGEMPQMSTGQALEVLETAKTAWDKGLGTWTTQYTTIQRLEAVYKVLEELQPPTSSSSSKPSTIRDEMIQVLQWEIGKNLIDATAEIDRTFAFAKQVMNQIVTNPEYNVVGPSQFQTYRRSSTSSTGSSSGSSGTETTDEVSSSSYTALTKRSAIGIVLLLAPYNYPINECYATLIPALLLGNICIVKIPAVGGLAHLLMMQVFAKHLPHGTINFISGSGATVLPSIMESGDIDALALIGSSKSADQLIRYHPRPNRLKLFLQLGAKNMGIVLPDVFKSVTESKSTTLFKNTISESVLGSLSFNGQRCTALKIFFVPKKYADLFVSTLAQAVEALTIGLPWQNHTETTESSSSSSSSKKPKISYSQITPLPNHSRVQFMKSQIDDAIEKGAKIMNRDGGTIIGGTSSTLMVPAIVYPVTSDMKLFTEEQFGPIVPIVTYDSIDEIIDYATHHNTEFAQQVSIFGQDGATISYLVDTMGSMIPKINFNSQCARSPDILPFAARRSSGMGVMSVTDVLEEFSLPTVIAYQNQKLNDPIAADLFQQSKFLGAVKTSATTTSSTQ